MTGPAWLIVIVVIVFIVFLLLTWRDNTNWLDLFEALDCCSVFGVLVLVSMVMIGGLVLWHSLLLVAGAGASILMLLLPGWSSTLRKHFLAKGKS
jgi:hypothetical protein